MYSKKNCPLALLLVFVSWQCVAQQSLEKEYPFPGAPQPLVEFIRDIESKENLRFFYRKEWIDQVVIRDLPGEATLREILLSALEGSEISFVAVDEHLVIFFKDPSRDLERRTMIESARRMDKSVEELAFGSITEYVAGKILSARGVIVDEETREPVSGATLYVNELKISVATNATGSFEVPVTGGEYLISIRHVNYREKLISLRIYKDAQLQLILEEEPTTLEEVVISDQQIVNRRAGQSALKMLELKRTPSLLGEPDLVRQLQLQSGVTTTSEAASGFNVRGGSMDQNLVLYDGVPVFNTAHALGFFAAFNSDAIKDATFYKGGMPAEFGGRASSVLNLVAREGDFEKWKFSGGVGMVASNLVAEGPIKKDTSSLIISARVSYSDWLLDLLKTKYSNIKKGSVFFYDGSIKYSHKLDRKSKITFSSYLSSDQFSLSNDTTYQWRNVAAAVRYDRMVTENLFYSAGLSFGHYDYVVGDEDPPTAFELNYAIEYPSLKIDFNRSAGLNKQTFGLHSTLYSFNPGKLRSTSPQSNILNMSMPRERSLETSIYGSNAFTLTDRLNLEVGLRLTMFNVFGPATVYQYAPGEPLEPKNTVDSLTYGAGEIIRTYFGPEPRVALVYTLGLNSSLKFGLQRLYQYVHLISNSASITPVDIWQSSNYYFKPQHADQASGGYFRNIKDNTFEFSTELYYKFLKNLLDFKDGETLILNRQLETALLTGKGHAYGIEFNFNKIKGKLTGGVNYTYSRSLRQVQGPSISESINNGELYPANHDQPHVMNMAWRYGLFRRLFFSGNFTYHTGRPASLPVSGFEVGNVPVSEFRARNSLRIPDYHRLDFAFVLEPGYRKRKILAGTWVLSIYNFYCRKNAYSVFFVDQGNGILKPYQLSLIGTVVPSLSYSFKF